jgi:hypothetical protein
MIDLNAGTPNTRTSHPCCAHHTIYVTLSTRSVERSGFVLGSLLPVGLLLLKTPPG